MSLCRSCEFHSLYPTVKTPPEEIDMDRWLDDWCKFYKDFIPEVDNMATCDGFREEE